MNSQVFSIPSPSVVSLLPVLLVPLLVTVAIAVALLTGLRLTCTVESAGVRMRGAGYGRIVAWSTIDRASVEIVDLRQRSEYRPKLKTNGIGLAGLRVGWFQLANGERALLFLSGAKTVVRVPTHDGFALLIGASDAPGLMRAITAHAVGDS